MKQTRSLKATEIGGSLLGVVAAACFCSRKSIVIAASLLVIVAAACFFDVYIFTLYSCLECRATLTKCRIYGIPFQQVSFDSYSTSVLQHDPSHVHQWRPCGCDHRYSLFTITYACGRPHPIWHLTVPIQARYSQLVPASELHDTLREIDSPDRKTAEAAVVRVYERVADSQ
jgi:hypothetical protein